MIHFWVVTHSWKPPAVDASYICRRPAVHILNIMATSPLSPLKAYYYYYYYSVHGKYDNGILCHPHTLESLQPNPCVNYLPPSEVMHSWGFCTFYTWRFSQSIMFTAGQYTGHYGHSVTIEGEACKLVVSVHVVIENWHITQIWPIADSGIKIKGNGGAIDRDR